MVLVAEAVPLAVVVLAAVVVAVLLAEALVVRGAVPRLSLYVSTFLFILGLVIRCKTNQILFDRSLIVTPVFSLSVVARKMVSQLEI